MGRILPPRRIELALHPNLWAYLGTLLFTLVGLIFMIRKREFRFVGAALALLLAYFAAATVIGASAEYRYRMPLEPIMILAIACWVTSLVPAPSARQTATIRSLSAIAMGVPQNLA